MSEALTPTAPDLDLCQHMPIGHLHATDDLTLAIGTDDVIREAMAAAITGLDRDDDATDTTAGAVAGPPNILAGSRDLRGLRGGTKRWRGRSMVRWQGPDATPDEGAVARGYRFPDDRATPGQMRELQRLMVAYVRGKTIRLFPDLTAELVGEALGLKERQAATVVGKTRNLDGTPDAHFVVEALHAMHVGRIAGVLGTPKNRNTRWFFERIYRFDAGVLAHELPTWLLPRVIDLPPDARPHGATWGFMEWQGPDGSLRTGDLFYSKQDGRPCVDDGTTVRDREILRMWLAAFKLDYRTWLGKREA